MLVTSLLDTVPAMDKVRERLDGLLSPSGPMKAPATYLKESTGKLLRPALTLLSATILGEVTDEVIDTAVAVELIHTASLVHDDVVDESDTRRGLPSVRCRFGNKSAVLLGDYLFTSAFEILNKSRKRRVIRVLSAAIKSMSAGEMLNLSNLYRTDVTEEDYYRYVGCKTASLMSASCEAGALAAGSGTSAGRRLSRFGWDLGMAYQVVDDLMDLTGAAEADGKPSGSDIRLGVVTLPVIRLLRIGDWGARVSAAWSRGSGDPASTQSADMGNLLNALAAHGCLSYAVDSGRTFAKSASRSLASFGESHGAGVLREFVRHVEDRFPAISLQHSGAPQQETHAVEPDAARSGAVNQCAGQRPQSLAVHLGV